MGNSTKELVNAFNLNNYASDKINTNFTMEGKKIVGLFASGTNIGEYLQRIGEEIIERHYLSGTEVAGAFYNLNCFPFVLGANPDKEYLGNSIVKVKLADSTDNGVIRNLKVHFANEFERAVISKVVARLQKIGVTEEEAYKWIRGTVKTGAIGMPYLYCIAFSDEYLYDSETFNLFKELYIQEFDSRLKECHVKSSDFYKYKDDMLYIKDVSDKVIKSVTEHVKKEIAFYFRTPAKEDSKVENFKDVLSSLMSERVRKSINTYDYDIFTNEKKIQNGNSFVLIPLIEIDDNQFETLCPNDARNIDRIFNNGILNHFYCISDIRGKTANPQYTNCKEPVYAFSNKQIALLLPKIMESPIAYNQINGRFEFAVDLENFKRRGSSRSSSTVTSPFNSPTHAEPPRTPPEQTGERFKEDRDSGIGESPPKPKDSVAHSPSGDPRSLFEQPQAQLRQGSEKKQGLYYPVNSTGTSGEFSPQSHLSYTAVSRGVAGPSSSSQSVGAAQNRWSPQGTSENKWISSMQFTKPGTSGLSWSQSGPSSWKGANPVGANPWAQQTNPCLSQGTSGNKWQLPLQLPGPGLSGLSWKGAAQNVQVGPSAWSQPMDSWSFPVPPAHFSSSGDNVSGSWPSVVRSSSSKGASERRTSDKPLTEKEKELIKALLYVFNINNHILECPNTNFIVENGKIASSINYGVNVKEYLLELRGYTIKKYCGTEEEAKKAYDLNEFPFKFLSNCEKNQETTVVANISRGALFNLKKLFIQEHEKKVEIEDIDINIVEKAVKSKKDKWVNSQMKRRGKEGGYYEKVRPHEAITTCCPDESVLKHIPIIKDKGGYCLDRTYGTWEVESLVERWSAKGTRNATTTFKKIEESKKDDSSSGYSSGFVTDAENVSFKAETTTSGDESMDCENTGGGLQKPTPELRVENLTISTKLDAIKTEQQPSPTKKLRSNDFNPTL